MILEKTYLKYPFKFSFAKKSFNKPSVFINLIETEKITRVAFSIASIIFSKSFTILSFILFCSLPFIFNLYYSASKRKLLQCNIRLVCSWISFNGICYCLSYWRRFTFRNSAWKSFHFLLYARITYWKFVFPFFHCSWNFDGELHISFFSSYIHSHACTNPFSYLHKQFFEMYIWLQWLLQSYSLLLEYIHFFFKIGDFCRKRVFRETN